MYSVYQHKNNTYIHNISPAMYKKAGSLNIGEFGGTAGITQMYLVPFTGIDTIILARLAL